MVFILICLLTSPPDGLDSAIVLSNFQLQFLRLMALPGIEESSYLVKSLSLKHEFLTRVHNHALRLCAPELHRELLGEVHQENLGVGVLHPRVEGGLARVNIKQLRVERGPVMRMRGLVRKVFKMPLHN